MTNFLLLYTGGTQPQSEAEGKAVMDAWIAWFTRLGPVVVDGGNPISPACKIIAPDGKVTDGPPGGWASGYSIIKAVKVAGGCPHLQAGGTVTVFETFPAM
jgi:hypothetical protein